MFCDPYGDKFLARVSTQELTYRSKHYHDIRVLKDRKLICSSCGNDVVVEAGKVFSHPIVGILQCKTCWEQLKEVNSVAEKNKEPRPCCLCGCFNNLYRCKRKDCLFAFCRKCIKRNASLSLLEVEAGNWKCFVCESKPFWELRAVCAAVLTSISKKQQKKKRIEGTMKEMIEKHATERIPASERHKFEKVQRVKRAMRTLCDGDTSSGEKSRSLSVFARQSGKYNSDDTERNDSNNTKDDGNISDFSESVLLPRTKTKRSRLCRLRARSSSLDSEKDDIDERQAECSKFNNPRMKEKNRQRMKQGGNKESDDTDTEVEKFHRKKKNPTTQSGQESSSEKNSQHRSGKKIRRASNKFHVEETADSSSGKEFEKSKLSRDKYGCLKKVLESKKDPERDYMKSVKVVKSDSTFSKQEGKTAINKKQSLRFKSYMSKVLNKFKEVCSEFELRMEHVKWKHFKKELIYKENAEIIVSKSRNVMNKLKMELASQEKELTTFYQSWCNNCDIQIMRHTSDESSSAENDDEENKEKEKERMERQRKKTKEKMKNEEDAEIVGPSDKENKRTPHKSIVSECDSEEIFSASEKSDEEISPTPEEILSKRDQTVSPILGSRHKTRTNKELARVCSTGDKQNESMDDMFDDSMNETLNNIALADPQLVQTDINLNDSKRERGSSQGITKVKSSFSTVGEDFTTLNSTNRDDAKNTCDNEALEEDEKKEESVSCESESKSDLHEEKSKSNLKRRGSSDNIDEIKATASSFSEMEAEEEAKQLLLLSDTDDEKSNHSMDHIARSSPDSLKKSIGSVVSERNNKDDKLGQDDATIGKLEMHAKHTLLDSNSDDSISPSGSVNSVKDPLERKLESDARKLLLVSSSESSSLSSSSEIASKSKVKLLTEDKRKSTKRGYDSAGTDSVGNRVKKRRLKMDEKLIPDNDDKLRLPCKVVLKQLGEDVLKEHARALQTSEQYLDYKVMQSLIDLERLEKKHNAKESPRSSKDSPKDKKRAKEVGGSLLDHLKKIENGEHVVIQEGSNDSDDNRVPRTPNRIQTTEELMLEADRATKNILLNSSDSDIGKDKMSERSDSDDGKTESHSVSRAPKKASEKSELKSSESDKGNEDEREKNKWRRNKILTARDSSDSNSDAEREKWDVKQKKLRAERQRVQDNDDLENSDNKEVSIKRKKRIRRRMLPSDSDDSVVIQKESVSSDDSDSTDGKKKKSDSLQADKRSKPRRKRIKKMATDSDSDSDSDHCTNSQGTPGKKGRKNIRKVMKDKQVAEDTKQAAKEEDERIRRIAERQRVYNEMYEARLAGEEKVEKLVLDFNTETKEDLVSVHKELVKRLKPHQAKGIKFMWDACFESLERMKTSSGSGCIIAHCMGLGKTLQVVALIHTLLAHEHIGVNTILVVCPLSTVLNWVNEFSTWLKDIDINGDIEVYELTKLKKNIERKYQLESWQRTGGVLIIGYEMFRNLCNVKKGIPKRMRESILKCLIDPGPDMIVCDEGHLLKNEDTALSKCIKQIKTLRRVVLTGTPLQNNLIEYHCMVQFVKPNLLGTRREFLNRFVNPITNGQFDDSTDSDVKLMKKRAYVLHKMLKGCVQRFDYSVLMPFLPPKQEYVIFVSLTEVQINMYRHYLANFARKQRAAGGSLFADFQALQRIWTHPLVMRLNAEKNERLNEKKFASSDTEGSLKEFIVSSSSESTSSSCSSSEDEAEIIHNSRNEASDSSKYKEKNNAATNETNAEIEENTKDEEWWLQFVQPEHFEDMRTSSKLILLFGILKECEQIGDKVLVFSQSLYSLTLIERFLEKIDDETQLSNNSAAIEGHTGSWSLGLDYFRLDGQTSAEHRNLWCDSFNKPSNTRARLFLISTRAGGLGINLTAANRVIIFDASWNPSHDVQSIFRVYRFGQKKPCYVYRFLAAGTMEEKIYNRQVTKLSLSCRVVDVQQIERHYSNHDLSELYKFEPNMNDEKPTLNLPKDRLLAEIFLKYKNCVENYHEHDSLLENKAEEELNEEERKQAWQEYEEEKKGRPFLPQVTMPLNPFHILNQFGMLAPTDASLSDYQKLQELIRKDYPNASPKCQEEMTARALTDMYNYCEQQAILGSSANRMIAQQTAAFQQALVTAQMSSMSRDTQLAILLAQPNANQNIRNQMVRNPFVSRNVEASASGIGIGAGTTVDDDVVEVPTTATTSSASLASHHLGNKNKNEEE